MSKEWDGKVKRLVSSAPQDFVNWLAQGAVHAGYVSSEMISRQVTADRLLRIKKDDRETNLQVTSWVIYLTNVGPFPASPIVFRDLITDEITSYFSFKSIKLWEISVDEFLDAKMKGLLPLLPLTQGGKSQEVIEEVISRLYEPDNRTSTELLSLTYGFASLVFTDKDDKDWLRWRFKMLEDILRDTWAFKELAQEAEEQGMQRGMQQGMQQGIEKGILQGQRQVFVNLVQAHFPDLAELARERIGGIHHSDRIQSLILEVSMLHQEEAVTQFLLNIIPEAEHIDKE